MLDHALSSYYIGLTIMLVSKLCFILMIYVFPKLIIILLKMWSAQLGLAPPRSMGDFIYRMESSFILNNIYFFSLFQFCLFIFILLCYSFLIFVYTALASCYFGTGYSLLCTYVLFYLFKMCHCKLYCPGFGCLCCH